MNDKEVVWVFGTSSVGKQSFIKNVTTDKDLAARFGWQNKKITICEESVNYPGSLDMPEIVRIRKEIPSIVSRHLESSDVELIKWQYVDSSCESPQNLKKLLPNARHRIILLKAPLKVLEQRLSTQDWWQDKWSNAAELVELELKMVKKFVGELQDDFEVTSLDSSKGGYYAVISG